ncbi:MAG: hypothetical protein L3K26_10180, partial [Candidatus Hydrogenedentes bacterium]|nr:hypothetical protein [Candidatus Hydrogenedentota bacterium]
MNVIAAKIVSNGLLKGAFDVFDAMLSCTFQFEVAEPSVISEEDLGTQLAQFPVALQGKIQNDLGSVAILFSVNDAARFSALIQEQEFTETEALSDDDRSMLKEIADPALGGGVTNLMERFGRNVEQLEEVQVIDSGADNAAALAALIGAEGGMATFTFTNNAD